MWVEKTKRNGSTDRQGFYFENIPHSNNHTAGCDTPGPAVRSQSFTRSLKTMVSVLGGQDAPVFPSWADGSNRTQEKEPPPWEADDPPSKAEQEVRAEEGRRWILTGTRHTNSSSSERTSGPGAALHLSWFSATR